MVLICEIISKLVTEHICSEIGFPMGQRRSGCRRLKGRAFLVPHHLSDDLPALAAGLEATVMLSKIPRTDLHSEEFPGHFCLESHPLCLLDWNCISRIQIVSQDGLLSVMLFCVVWSLL
jgi:hypothetical protein